MIYLKGMEVHNQIINGAIYDQNTQGETFPDRELFDQCKFENNLHGPVQPCVIIR